MVVEMDDPTAFALKKVSPTRDSFCGTRVLHLKSCAVSGINSCSGAKVFGKVVTAHAGQNQADSSGAPQSASHTQTPSASNATQSAQETVPSEGNEKASVTQPDTASKPNLASVLKSSRGHAPSKAASPRSPRQPGSPIDRKTRSGTLQVHLPCGI